ncbi:MAG: hypothetical protein R6U22_01305 [Desulfohalobiaceae bacterium]
MLRQDRSKWVVFGLVVVFLFMVFGSKGFAEITEEYDDFNGTRTYTSNIENIEVWNRILFMIDNKEKSDKYDVALTFYTVDNERNFSFAGKDLAMKINGEIKEVSFVDDFGRHSNNKYIRSGVFKPKHENLKDIKNANKITIRTYMRDIPNKTWDVPEKVLNEWKELIEMSGVLEN